MNYDKEDGCCILETSPKMRYGLNIGPANTDKLVMKKALLLFAMTMLTRSPAFATLGENESSVDLDSQDMVHAKHMRVSQTQYTVHQIVSDETTILEYADLNGTVFAVSWNGPHVPVLAGLLGRYAVDIENRMKLEVARHPAGNTRPRMSHTSLDAGRITIENFGHMGGTQKGRAYVPTLIPNTISLAEIK